MLHGFSWFLAKAGVPHEEEAGQSPLSPALSSGLGGRELLEGELQAVWGPRDPQEGRGAETKVTELRVSSGPAGPIEGGKEGEKTEWEEPTHPRSKTFGKGSTPLHRSGTPQAACGVWRPRRAPGAGASASHPGLKSHRESWLQGKGRALGRGAARKVQS